jgi:Tfp pilus assembly protein PilO
MSSYLDKLNLRPGERRLVVGIVVVIFIVLNVLLVWPHFSDWAKVRNDLAKAQSNLVVYNKKIAQAKGPNGFEGQLKKLEGEGEAVVAEEQEIQLIRTVQSKVAENKVTVTDYGKVAKSNNTQNTNEFFEEQSLPITVNAGEKELVDFLLNVGSGSSMIRVRDLDLRPVDQNRYRLQGRITLSANYQKKVAAKPAAPATGTKPAAITPQPAPRSAPPAIKPAAPVVRPTSPTVKKK